MNEVIKAMLERRSIRKFKKELPKREDIETILETGLYAANGKGRQATLTVAITNPVLRARLVEANRKIGGWAEGFDPFYGNRAREEFEQPEFIALLKELGVAGEWIGIGHCAVGYIEGELPKAAPRKPGRVLWVE